MSKVVDASMWLRIVHGPQPGVAAVSGGADSVALLRGLHETGLRPIVGHFNHRLRGAESDADEAFVRELAESLGLECRVGSADVAAIAAEHRENLEATARRVRYEWLTRLAKATDCRWVVTGHTLDDHAETILHRIIRGTGLRGLKGIPAFRFEDGLELHRPFLLGKVTRADVMEHLASRDQPYREDPSNADPRFTRNRIRHELLPLLKELNPEVAEALFRLADHADKAAFSIRLAAGKLRDAAELPRAGDVLVFDAAHFNECSVDATTEEECRAALSRYTDPYLIQELFRELWEDEGWPLGRMTATHWQTVVDVARGKLPAADFPGGVHVRRVGTVVQLSRKP